MNPLKDTATRMWLSGLALAGQAVAGACAGAKGQDPGAASAIAGAVLPVIGTFASSFLGRDIYAHLTEPESDADPRGWHYDILLAGGYAMHDIILAYAKTPRLPAPTRAALQELAPALVAFYERPDTEPPAPVSEAEVVAAFYRGEGLRRERSDTPALWTAFLRYFIEKESDLPAIRDDVLVKLGGVLARDFNARLFTVLKCDFDAQGSPIGGRAFASVTLRLLQTIGQGNEKILAVANALEPCAAARHEEVMEKLSNLAEGDAAFARNGHRLLDAPHRVLDEDVQFTVYRPQSMPPGDWQTWLVFAHREASGPDVPDYAAEVESQAQALLGAKFQDYAESTQESSAALPRESTITVIPNVRGLEFNPAQRQFVWQEPIHREEFRARARGEFADQTMRGKFTFYLGAIIIAEINVRVSIVAQTPAKAAPAMSRDRSRGYRKIFASYSRRDQLIVDHVERLVAAFGDRYLRDVHTLRSGEEWSPGLERLIHEADVFQLFWSTHSMRSPHVRQEWEFALALGRRNFVRPTYWEEPFPKDESADLPPDRLRAVHFQKLPFCGETPASASREWPPPAPPASIPALDAEVIGSTASIRPARRVEPSPSFKPPPNPPAKSSRRFVGVWPGVALVGLLALGLLAVIGGGFLPGNLKKSSGPGAPVFMNYPPEEKPPPSAGDAEPPATVAAPEKLDLNAGTAETKKVKDEVLTRIELMPITAAKKDQLLMSVERARQMGKVLTIPFGKGLTTLTPADVSALKTELAKPELVKLCDDLTAFFVILGFADPKGDPTMNRQFSQQRADAVLAAMRDKCKVANVMHAVAMGGSTLLDAQNLAKNRIVEVWVVLP